MRGARREGPYVVVAMQLLLAFSVFAAFSLSFAGVPPLLLVILTIGAPGAALCWLLGSSVSIDGDSVTIKNGRFLPASTVRLSSIRLVQLKRPWFAVRSQVRILCVVDAHMREHRIPAISVAGPLYMFDLRPGGGPPELGALAKSLERATVPIQME